MSESFTQFASITKKISMSIIGLFLAVFLVVHLGINFLLLLEDPEPFRSAVEFMSSPFIKVFEIVLFAAFLIHIVLGITLWVQNRIARPVAYVKQNKSETSLLSKYMMHTGIIILIFLILHFVHFFFVKIGLVAVPEGAADIHDFYTMSRLLFAQPLYIGIYLISFLALGFHLNHAIQSGFQSLGLNHSKYTPFIKKISTGYSILIVLGFSIVAIALFIQG